MPKTDSVLGCIVGGAIGDAAASAFEGLGADSPESSNWLDQVWQLTDDTQLTLATCEALTTGKVDPAIIAEHMLRWFRAKRIRRVGSMRIAPLAFCTECETSKGRQLIRDVCRITHHNEEAYVGAFATVLAITASMASSKPPLLKEIACSLPDSVVRDRILTLAGSETTMSIAEAARKNGTSGFVADSVPLTIFAGQQVPRIGFTEMLEQIIKVGGDTDTIASIACQLAGAVLGLSGLPNHLIERLPDREIIMDVAHRFAHRPGSKSE